MASLSLQRVSKRFGRVSALAGVDLEVGDGEFCVLLGPSGCGKSTLLNIVAGLEAQDQGTVRLDGEPVDHLAPRDRDMAMVFQNYALYPHMTVAENLGFGLRMRRVPQAKIRENILWAAELLGISDLLQRKPRELSGGQRQRVAMGRALVRRPRVFLLDEPLSNLDARLRARVRVELRELHRTIRGTILYVTHDQVEAMTLGDKVVVMKDGVIRQCSPPEIIYARPADTFVACFIGSPEMNLYRGRLLRTGARLCFQGAGFDLDLTGLTLEAYDGYELELGVRAEDAAVAEAGSGQVRVRAELVSNTGAEQYLHARMGREKITLRLAPGADYEPGRELGVNLNPGKLHLFREGRRLPQAS